ncbi:uncharacterized protein LOC120081925 [Benincasa hispida]|uniref:uncharacterized protein LOC120081925 n=1 Tax=Benincasa hispida TaxID=102211 RepID=UPI001902341A|nr:uncharacterized protein LOC120081925 [Benincasa hispida]
MSDPPSTSSEPPQHRHHHHQQILHLPVIHGGASAGAGATRMNTVAAAAASSSTVIVREYRKGNWTLQETMILITAKKLDDERRNKANLGPAPADPAARKGGELRWKWVENYCWSHGCQRSQNQCNDKWDNLLRDYKKVREYESRACDQQLPQIPSYWKMEKHERKDKNLPSNLAFEVYQALNDVVQRKFSQKPSNSGLLLLPPPAPPPPSAIPPPPPTSATISPPLSDSSSSGTESSEKKEKIEAKRRKMGDNIGRSIERSISALTQTLHSCEEQREIQHQQLMELRKRRLQIEETRNHIHRQGIADLVAAVANLSAGMNNRTARPEEYGCLYSGEEVRILKEQNEAMQAELMNVKSELSQLRDQMPSLMQTMMHNMIHNIQPPPPTSMDPSGSGGDA